MLDAVGLRHALAAGNGARGQQGDDNGRGEPHYYGDGVQGAVFVFRAFVGNLNCGLVNATAQEKSMKCLKVSWEQ